MDNGFSKLTYSQIQSIADQLNTTSTEMETLLTEISNLLIKVGEESVWAGTAAAITKETFDTLSAKFPEFSQAVNKCSTYLLQVVENYKSVDSMVTGQQ